MCIPRRSTSVGPWEGPEPIKSYHLIFHAVKSQGLWILIFSRMHLFLKRLLPDNAAAVHGLCKWVPRRRMMAPWTPPSPRLRRHCGVHMAPALLLTCHNPSGAGRSLVAPVQRGVECPSSRAPAPPSCLTSSDTNSDTVSSDPTSPLFIRCDCRQTPSRWGKWHRCPASSKLMVGVRVPSSNLCNVHTY